MVRFLTLGLLLLSTHIYSAELRVSLSEKTVEMGKAIQVVFTYEGIKEPETIDLELWQNDFHIRQSDSDLSQHKNGAIISTTKVLLYPRKVGDFTLDAIALGGSFVKSLHVTVTPSIRNQIDATPLIHKIKTSYWADEPIFITVDVPLHNSHNEVIAKAWEPKGMTAIALKSIKTATHVQLKWMLYTPHKGHYRLDLPAIVQRGRGRFRFHSPFIEFTVKPLPAYLPSSVASGHIKISSKIINNDGLKVAQITFRKAGYLPKEIEGLQQFITALSDDELALNIQTLENINQGIAKRQVSVTLPDWLWGQNLTLKVRYFNTQTGRLDTIKHQLPKVYNIPRQAQLIAIGLGIIVLLFTLKALNKTAQKWRYYKKLKQRVLEANNAQELRLTLLNNGQFKTLDEWESKNNSTEALKFKVTLNQACYQPNNKIELHELKKTLITRTSS